VIAPGAHGVEVGGELGRKARGDEFAGEFDGDGAGEVLKHDQADEERVAWSPRSGGVAENAELKGKVLALGGDRGVDATSVEIEVMELLSWKRGDSAVGSGAELEDALSAVVFDESVTEDLCEFTGGVSAKKVHLEEAVLRGDETLGEYKVVQRRGADVGDAMCIALNGHRSREAGERKGSVDLRQCGYQEVVNVAASGEEAGDAEDDENGNGDGEVLKRSARAWGARVAASGGTPWEECGLGRWIRNAHRYGEG
jgi:hypothetical protein